MSVFSAFFIKKLENITHTFWKEKGGALFCKIFYTLVRKSHMRKNKTSLAG